MMACICGLRNFGDAPHGLDCKYAMIPAMQFCCADRLQRGLISPSVPCSHADFAT